MLVCVCVHVFVCYIPYAAFSNFQILIGDVDLRPRPELLDVAVPSSLFGFTFVSDEKQTATVLDMAHIRLDWLRWVSEVLGSSAGNSTFTVFRTQLDESGNGVGTTHMLGPSEPPERIVVKLDPEANEYYIEIASVVTHARSDAEDPDRATYELEACVPQPVGECFSSNITVYAIERLGKNLVYTAKAMLTLTVSQLMLQSFNAFLAKLVGEAV